MGEAASPGPTRHDWFHLSMRVQHVTKTARSQPRGTKEDLQQRDLLSKKIERIDPLAAMARPSPRSSGSDRRNLGGARDAPKHQIQPTAICLKKLTEILRDLETYVSGQFISIITYAAAQRSAEPISTVPTESAVHRLLHRRMTAKQQMRWSPRGAHFMLKIRTAVMNGAFERDHVALGPSTRCLQGRLG